MKNIDTNDLRKALGSFATGVTVVTSRDAAGNPVAMTVNSFASVSLDPPLVLWSLDRKADLYHAFSVADHYAVHVLRRDQEAVSNQCAAIGGDRLAGMDIVTGVETLPLLRNYCARFQCKVEHRYEGGDHIILVGRVLDMDHQPADPLVFHGGEYRDIQ